jgi:DNA-binding NarL/FixJ family response regulator
LAGTDSNSDSTRLDDRSGPGRATERMSGEAIRVLVLADQPVFAEALALAIDASPPLACIGVASDVEGVLRVCAETAADVIVMDAQLSGGDGIDTARSCLEVVPDARVLMLSENLPTAALVRAAVDAGASALLSKTANLASVVEAIPSLTGDGFTIDKDTVRMLCGPASPGSPGRRQHEPGALTRRERDILWLLVNGIDLQTASVRLGISVNTSRGYVKNLYRKLGVHNQLELVAVARRRGLLEE